MPEAFLEEAHLAHFATAGPDGRPRVRPIWFCYADGVFWFTTRLEARRTGADVANGSPVAVSIANENRPYRGVIAYGRPEVWKKDTRLAAANRHPLRRSGGDALALRRVEGTRPRGAPPRSREGRGLALREGGLHTTKKKESLRVTLPTSSRDGSA